VKGFLLLRGPRKPKEMVREGPEINYRIGFSSAAMKKS
jgi:hypothetical protein